jgi:hypothetical protein
MRRQIPEKLRATRTAFPRTERGNDAVRRSAWKMNKGRRKIQQMEREAVCMIKRTPLLCITVFAGVNHQSHTVELVDWFLQAFVYQEMELRTMIRKDHRNLTPNPALAPEGRALISSGRINTRGIYLPNPERLHPVFSQAQAGRSIIAGGGDQKTIRRPFLIRQFFGDKTFAR